MRTSSRIAALAVIAAVSAGALTSCQSAAQEFERALIAQAEAVAGAASLPGSGTPFESWDEMVIICPYMNTLEGLDPKFARAITNDQDFLDESAQWFIFAQEQQTESLRLSRSKVDFCAGRAPMQTLPGDQGWTANQRDGRWVFTPVD